MVGSEKLQGKVDIGKLQWIFDCEKLERIVDCERLWLIVGSSTLLGISSGALQSLIVRRCEDSCQCGVTKES